MPKATRSSSTAGAPTSAPEPSASTTKSKRTKACEACRKLRCKCAMLAGAVCERCLEKGLPCSGPADTPQRLEKLEKSQEMKDVSGDPLRLVQVTRIASGELHVYQQVSFGGPIETEVVTGEVNLIIEETS